MDWGYIGSAPRLIASSWATTAKRVIENFERVMKDKILQAIAVHCEMVERFADETVGSVLQAAELVSQFIKNGGAIYICGNGGSAADAQHISGELVGRFQKERKAIAAVALSTDTSVISAIANDYSFEQIFARQIEGLGKKSDCLWAISTSGTSVNVIAAVKKAREKGLKILGFVGRAGSELEQLSDVCVCIESQTTARCQEIQQLAYHIICELVEDKVCE